MSWNYRVIRAAHDGEVTYAIHECFYAAGGDAIPTAWSTEPDAVMSETRTGLLWVLSVMASAISKPVLEVVGSRLVAVEAARELSDDLSMALFNAQEYSDGMASATRASTGEEA